MSQWWEALETDPDYGDGELADEISDEYEDDPASWDLGDGRAASVGTPRSERDFIRLIAALPERELVALVRDGFVPDGTTASLDERVSALRVIATRDETLVADLIAAVDGTDMDGRPVSADRRMQAHERLDKMRLNGRESWRNPKTGEIHFATGDSRGGDRETIRTPPSTRKLSSAVKARKLLADECSRRGWELDALIQPFAPGRQTKTEMARRAQVAVLVATVRSAGVTLDAIGQAIGLPKQRVFELDRLGSTMLERLAA